MGIASFVLGLISIIMGWIPFLCFIMLMTAIIGLILGIIDAIKKGKTNDKTKGFGIAGLVLSAIAIPIILIMSLVSIGIMVEDIEADYDYHYDYDDDYDYDEWYDYWYNQPYHKNGWHHDRIL